ncbi:hypothetical protein LRS06_19020 [Hymenobacter sp. J193]|uniref:hypothetical protein n=1 Tax=Hymenobacter sp. J193 TaxID=2898429 RepID=UPI002151EA9B|nr:hypothetical protein [Hymenobacter sp. J193]MCR5889823.1 hypothetical protein [Hymenobacter sp. J193]
MGAAVKSYVFDNWYPSLEECLALVYKKYDRKLMVFIKHNHFDPDTEEELNTGLASDYAYRFVDSAIEDVDGFGRYRPVDFSRMEYEGQKYIFLSTGASELGSAIMTILADVLIELGGRETK